MPWTQKWSVLVEVELFKGTLKILNHRILMIEHCLTDKETCPFYQKACIQNIILKFYVTNQRMLHALLNVKV